MLELGPLREMHSCILSCQLQSDNGVKNYGQNIEQCIGWNPTSNLAFNNSGFFFFFFHFWSTPSEFRSHFLAEFEIH